MTAQETLQLPPILQGQLDVLMIDNFDSFTWNLYQQLCLLGATVTVIRNDAITPDHFPLLKLNSLVISPGPGHPHTDSGISRDAIKYFEGKVPILGVCMGLECIVDVYGGTIAYAGEIMHGKVSPVRHDNRGCFKDVPQGIKSIRYHSLSTAFSTLPSELAITSTTEESGVIMGVRHREYTIEAVQYHPESILSEGGDELVKNFLSLRGGTWAENPESRVLDSTLPSFAVESLPDGVAKAPSKASKVPSILDKIYAQRLQDVEKARTTPGTTPTDLETLYNLNIAPPLINFVERLRQGNSGTLALLAEIKRASPSKGPISLNTNPAQQALTYALAGAHTISVLTEPKWFLGSLQDMHHARMSVAHLPNRPAILRKDFILSRYQIMEARVWGADTVLLIVSMLPEPTLRDLYKYSQQLGMEPLVEVNNAKEMELALSLPAKVIGVNNRNLHSFNVDMNTTSRLTDMVKNKDVTLLALSGISTADDVKKYASEGVQGVLVGESLMRAKDTGAFIRQLLSIPDPAIDQPLWKTTPPLVKVCGIRTKEEALAVAGAGADLLGLVFVPSSKRAITIETAKDISKAIRGLRFSSSPSSSSSSEALSLTNSSPWFTAHAARLSHYQGSKPLLVGIFQDASFTDVLNTIAQVQLDIVQLHGNEPFAWAAQLPVPAIKVFHVSQQGGQWDNREVADSITRGGGHQFILLDSLRDDGSGVSGGSGKVVDWDLASNIVQKGEVPGSLSPADNSGSTAKTSSPSKFPLPIMLAGGLTLDNVAEAIRKVQPWAVDVSGGVEGSDGKSKDLEKVRAFIYRAKQA